MKKVRDERGRRERATDEPFRVISRASDAKKQEKQDKTPKTGV